VGAGQGPGLSNVNLGQVAGGETTTLTLNQMPNHGHLASASQASGTATRPANQVPAAGQAVYTGAGDGSTLNPAFIQPSGSGQPFAIMQPYLGLNYIIALQGIFPSRN
jgi:microcystin-dependent protein